MKLLDIAVVVLCFVGCGSFFSLAGLLGKTFSSPILSRALRCSCVPAIKQMLLDRKMLERHAVEDLPGTVDAYFSSNYDLAGSDSKPLSWLDFSFSLGLLCTRESLCFLVCKSSVC